MEKSVDAKELQALEVVLESTYGKSCTQVIADLNRQLLEQEFWLHEYQVSARDALPLKPSGGQETKLP